MLSSHFTLVIIFIKHLLELITPRTLDLSGEVWGKDTHNWSPVTITHLSAVTSDDGAPGPSVTRASVVVSLFRLVLADGTEGLVFAPFFH